jgi:DNA-binding beta-propeller fold protein YncE
MLLSYSGVAGFADGAFALTLLKEPHVLIDSFTATPALTPLTGGSAKVTLSWTTEHAGILMLEPIHADVTDKQSFEATIERTTTFTLTAYGPGPGGVDNLAIANATTTVIPVLNSFAATPQAIAVDDFGGGQASVALQWSVDAPLRSELQLSSSIHGIYPTEFQSFGSTSLHLKEPQMFTLNIDGDTRWQDMWRLYVPAFSLRKSATANTGGAHAVAAPGASYVVVAQAANNQLAILSTASFSQIATVSCGNSPQGLVFSPDGNTLYVANQGDGTIGTIAVTASPQQTPPWSFAAGTAISVGGAPAQVALAPAGGYLYATVGASGAPGTLAMVSLADGSINNVPVGNDPYGLAVTPSGAQLFVANRGDGTVSQIGIAPNGTPQLIRTLVQLPGAAGLAVTPDGNTLLVACSDGTVQLLDAIAPDTAPRTAVQVGGRPMDIALDPSGAYAFVIDSAGGQVSLVNIAKAAVIGSPVSVGASPLGISVSPDGMLVFVGHASTLTVLSLDTYTLRSNPPNCGGYVTDVAVSADGSSAFFWADASENIKGAKPAVGLHVYDVASETLRAALPDARIIGMAVASAAGDAFLTQMGQSAVYPVDPLHLTLGAPLAIPAKNGLTQRQPMALAAAVDGSRVFALVSDDSHQFSIVVFNKGNGGYTLSADVTVYTASATPITPRLAAAPDGSAAYAYDGTSGNLWSVTANGAGFTLGEPLHLGVAVAAGILPSPNGSTLYIAGQHQLSTVFFIVDCAAWTVRRLPLSEPVTTMTIRGMALSPDGTRILISDPSGGTVRFIDTSSMRFLQTIVDPGSFKAPAGTAMSPDQSRLFVTDQSGQVATAIQVRPATNQGA